MAGEPEARAQTDGGTFGHADRLASVRRTGMSGPGIDVRMAAPADAEALERTGATVFDNEVRRAWLTELDNPAARALYASVGGVEDAERAVVFVFPLVSATGSADA